MKNPFSLSGKSVLITGASSGIGRATAIICAVLGARVIITGRNVERLSRTLASLEGEGHQSCPVDLNDKKAVADFVKGIEKLDGVVYCAGIQKTCIAKMLHRENLDMLFETNFFSIASLNTLILENRKLNKGASVVFVSSVTAISVAEIGNSAYSATKGALSAFARVLALELSSRKIRVNIVSPGMVRTPLLEQCEITEEQFEVDEKKYPLGYGEPEDVAHAIVFLLSDASRWTTGTNLVLDGGLTLL